MKALKLVVCVLTQAAIIPLVPIVYLFIWLLFAWDWSTEGKVGKALCEHFGLS